MANSMEAIKAALMNRKIEIPRAARVQWLPRLDQILHTLNYPPNTKVTMCYATVVTEFTNLGFFSIYQPLR